MFRWAFEIRLFSSYISAVFSCTIYFFLFLKLILSKAYNALFFLIRIDLLNESFLFTLGMILEVITPGNVHHCYSCSHYSLNENQNLRKCLFKLQLNRYITVPAVLELLYKGGMLCYFFFSFGLLQAISSIQMVSEFFAHFPFSTQVE